MSEWPKQSKTVVLRGFSCFAKTGVSLGLYCTVLDGFDGFGTVRDMQNPGRNSRGFDGFCLKVVVFLEVLTGFYTGFARVCAPGPVV